MTQRSSDNRLPVPVTIVSGSISGGLSSLIVQPLDVIKTRLQVGVPCMTLAMGPASQEPVRLTGAPIRSYSSISLAAPVTVRSTVEEIIRHRGFLGLWSGTSATLARTVPGVGVYFCILSEIKHKIMSQRPPRSARDPLGLTPMESIVAGASARSLAGLIFNPLSLLKARLESGLWGYSGIHGGLTSMYRTEGVAGFYRGMGATMMRDAPYAGAFVMAYESNKAWYRCVSGLDDTSFLVNTTLGAAASMFACGITHPFDVMKTMVQVQPHRYRTVFSAAQVIYSDRGIIGFYKGFGARLARKGAMAGMTWALFEEVTRTISKL